MGHNFNREARGEELAVYAESALRSLDPIKDLPPEKKPRIYYAMGADGLSTSCSGESRSKFVDMAGGRNAMACSDAVSHARPTISFEELMVMDPDIILVESNELKKKVLSEDRWGILRATKEGRVYLVPRGPFSWNGHPPLTVLMGSRWLANVLYPDLFPFDVIAATKEFYGLFFRMEFTDDMVKELLDPSLAER
jgi:iron complex transport system substrate-binding protein